MKVFYNVCILIVSYYFSFKDELLCDTLDRMQAECDEFLDFEDIMEYFTRRGRPKYTKKKEEDKEFKEKLVFILILIFSFDF